MKKFALVAKDDEISIKVAITIQKKLIDAGLEYDETHPQIVCVIGGDGTFLSAIHKYMNELDNIVFTGVHTGTLGFFVDYSLKEMDQCINDILTKQPRIEKKRLLEINIENQQKFYAVNEMWLQSHKTKTIDVYLNDQHLEKFHGSGLVISTQTGSTAFNRSLNGAVVEPSIEVMEMAEIGGIHHSHYRSLKNPLIVAPETEIKLACEDLSNTKLCFDRFDFDLSGKKEIICTLSQRKLQIAHYKSIQWVEHLKQLY